MSSDVERLFQILTENSFIISLGVCKEILQEIAEFCNIIDGFKCDYFEYCGNFIYGITDKDYQEYKEKIQSGLYQEANGNGNYYDSEYIEGRPFQFICTD